ncbi:MAG: DUF3375 family protein [Methylococcales bacterium]
MQLARELRTDFRELEHNLRLLDRRVRERIALWQGAKEILLEEIMGERDAIADSYQGKSFRAFWDFLMSSSRQEELTELRARGGYTTTGSKRAGIRSAQWRSFLNNSGASSMTRPGFLTM